MLQQISAISRFWLLFRSDAQNLSRDPILLLATIFSSAPAPLFVANRSKIDQLGLSMFDVANTSVFIAPMAMLLPAFLIGWVAGFLLLEDRDDHTLLAIETTTIGKTGFISYRLAIAGTLGAVLTLIAALQIYPEQPIAYSLITAALVALETAIVALLLLALAGNKVEGLALSKVLNIGVLLPVIAAIPSPWRMLGGIAPSYWIGEIVSLSQERYLPISVSILLAIVIHVVCLLWLLKVASQRTEKL